MGNLSSIDVTASASTASASGSGASSQSKEDDLLDLNQKLQSKTKLLGIVMNSIFIILTRLD